MAMGMLTIRHVLAALAVRYKENVSRILRESKQQPPKKTIIDFIKT
jgi:hypothetical protein